MTDNRGVIIYLEKDKLIKDKNGRMLYTVTVEEAQDIAMAILMGIASGEVNIGVLKK